MLTLTDFDVNIVKNYKPLRGRIVSLDAAEERFADGVIADCTRFAEWPPEGKLNEFNI